MAVSVTLKRAGKFHRSWDVVASADGDTTTGAFNHGLATRTGGLAIQDPDVQIVTWVEGLLPTLHGLSAWACSSRTATQLTFDKTTAVGSGSASIQVRLHAARIAAMNG